MLPTVALLVALGAVPSYEAELGKASTQIGEPIWLRVTVRSDLGDAQLVDPLPLPGAFVERSRRSHSLLDSHGVTETRFDVELMPFSVGDFDLGPFPIETHSGLVGQTNIVHASVASAFSGALPQESNPLLELLSDDPGPRSVLTPVFPPEAFLVLLLIGGALAAVVTSRRRKPSAPKPRRIPQIPPDELALAKLSALEHQHLLERDRHDAFFTSLSEIVRAYAGEAFSFPAVESTRAEIVTTLSGRGVERDGLSKIDELLAVADLAKFARSKPRPEEGLRLIEVARSFVETTRERPQP